MPNSGRFQAGHKINNGRVPWNRGLKTPDSTKRKQSDAKKGRSWEDIFGSEEAAKRRMEISNRMKGNNYNSRGLGQGGGYTGKYKKWYFRSLIELTFIIESEESGLEIFNAENLYPITMDNGRVYKPDFYAPDFFGPTLIEIKPMKRINDPDVEYKSRQAAEFAKENYMQYTIGFDRMLSKGKLAEVYESGDLILTDKMKKRLERRLYAEL